MGNNNGRPNESAEDSRKFVCVLYDGNDKTHKKNTKAFKDALQGDCAGKNLKTSLFDVNGEQFHAVSYLKEKRQNLILLSVDKEGAESLEEAIDKNWIKQHALPRVLSVSFGTIPPQKMIKILQHRPPMDKKDFCFEFKDVSKLDANDFSNSPVMNELVTSLIAA